MPSAIPPRCPTTAGRQERHAIPSLPEGGFFTDLQGRQFWLELCAQCNECSVIGSSTTDDQTRRIAAAKAGGRRASHAINNLAEHCRTGDEVSVKGVHAAWRIEQGRPR